MTTEYYNNKNRRYFRTGGFYAFFQLVKFNNIIMVGEYGLIFLKICCFI